MDEPVIRAAAPLRVLIVDSDDRVRESLTGLLGIGHDVVVVGSAGKVSAAIDLVASASPDVVVIDPRLPATEDGLDCIDRLRAAAPHVRILVLGQSDCPDRETLATKADGIVRKTFRPSELVAAIIATGRQAVP